MLDKAQSYLGRTYIGTNDYDKGQCVGLYNKVVQDVTGLLYPLQGAQGAKDLITCKNTRPDMFQQIKNNPNDPNMLPAVGDWVVWGSTWGGGYGHVACVKTVSVNGFTSIEQNFVANKVTEQTHNWSGVIGWVRYIQPQAADPCADVKSQLAAAQTTINTQKIQIDNLTKENAALKSNIDSLNKTITDLQAQVDRHAKTIAEQQEIIQEQLNKITEQEATINDLKKQLAASGDTNVTINFNNFGQILWSAIQLFGIKNKEK